MHLVFADLHLGRDPGRDPALIGELRDCIQSYAEDLDGVIFLGDVFDSYMEFPGRPDASAALLEPVLSMHALQGVPVEYVVGNHDPWHLGHFRDAWGVVVHEGPVVRKLYRRRVYLSHGDEEDRRGTVSRIARHFMRSPSYYVLYRTLLPTRFGQSLPRAVSKRWAETEVREATVRALREGAGRVLASGAADVVDSCRCEWPNTTTSAAPEASTRPAGVVYA